MKNDSTNQNEDSAMIQVRVKNRLVTDGKINRV